MVDALVVLPERTAGVSCVRQAWRAWPVFSDRRESHRLADRHRRGFGEATVLDGAKLPTSGFSPIWAVRLGLVPSDPSPASVGLDVTRWRLALSFEPLQASRVTQAPIHHHESFGVSSDALPCDGRSATSRNRESSRACPAECARARRQHVARAV